MGSSSPFNPHSPLALVTANLFIFILVIAGVIFALVAIILIISIIRFREGADRKEPSQIFNNPRLELVWTIIPILTLSVVFVYMMRVIHIVTPTSTANPDLIVIGHQWWWEIRYPKEGVVTANEIHIPAGKKMLVQLESADVIHDLWIPELGPKMDLVPGQNNYMYLQASTPGVYLGTCAEFCGADHAWMRVRAIAQTQAQYEAWIKAQAQPAAQPGGGQAAQGAQLFQQLPCSSCHTIDGTKAQGQVGPDLTHFASRQTLGAGVLDNTPANVSSWLKNPQAVKPGNHMPNLGLSDPQIQALLAYLETLR
jgi:cytochrome c oxidase subunit 2